MSRQVTCHAVAHLPCGRAVAYGSAGPRDGFVVFYLHGAIGSPMVITAELAEMLEDRGLRLVFPQRPGFGASEPHPGRTLLDFAGDLGHLADLLGAERFAVVGVSAGGPYAVACAARDPHRMTACAAVSSLSPFGAVADIPGLPLHVRLGLRTLRRAPRAVTRIGDRAVGVATGHPRLLARVMASGAPEADRHHLADPGTARAAEGAFLTAVAGGVGGLIEDHLVTSRPWGFDLGQVRGDVRVWHGMQDALVPVDHALQLAAALPLARVAIDPDEGHFFFRRRAHEIVADLAPDRVRRRRARAA